MLVEENEKMPDFTVLRFPGSVKQPLPAVGLRCVGASDRQAEGRQIHTIVLHPPSGRSLVYNVQKIMTVSSSKVR